LPVKPDVSYNSHMKKVGEYLKEKREEREMSLREAGSAAGFSHVHVRDIEEETKKPSFDKVMALLRAYHADVQDFLRETGYLPRNVEPADLPKTRQVPLVSWVLAGKWAEVCDSFQPGDADEWLETSVRGRSVFALTVRGDSMEPEFKEGEIIVVNPHVGAKPGDFVIVKNNEDEATFKQLKVYGGTTVLHPLNPKYPDIELRKGEKYQIVGKIVEKKKRY